MSEPKTNNTPKNAVAPRWISGIEPAPELLHATGIEILERECLEQPARLADLIERYAGDSEMLAQLIALRKTAVRGWPVLFLGMGGSLCSSFSGSSWLQSHGRLAVSLDAGEWLHYGASAWSQAALSIVLTTSGESAEIVELFRRGAGQQMALICNNEASRCWAMAEHRVPILAGPEYGNATKTYTNAAAAAIVVASAILELDWERDARRALSVMDGSLEPILAQRAELDAFCEGAVNIELIGRGAAYGAAVMGALTIREMSGFRAAAHTGAGFRHGPNLDVDSSHVAVIFALGRTAQLGFKLAEECNRRGGKVVLVSAEEQVRTQLLYPLAIEAVAEPWEGITSIVAAQALTLGMVERMGCRLPPRFQYGVMEQ